MEKTIHSRQYHAFLRHLRATRKKLGISQEELAKRLGETQSFVSKCERGDRRMDIIEVRAFCLGMGISVESFVREFEQSLAQDKPVKQ